MTPSPSVFPFVLCTGISIFYRVYFHIPCLTNNCIRTRLCSLVYLIRLVRGSRSFQHLQVCEIPRDPGDLA